MFTPAGSSVCLLVCLPVCLIFMKLCRYTGHGKRNNHLDFENDPGWIPDIRIFLNDTLTL